MSQILTDPTYIAAVLAAIAVFATVLMLAMPVLQSDDLSSRMKSAVIEREKIRQREREKMAKNLQRDSLKKTENEGIAKKVVDRLNLKNLIADEKTYDSLKMAGYRQQSHITMFLFFRVVMPLVLLVVAAFYIFGLGLLSDTVLIARIGIILGIAFLGYYLPGLFVSNQVTKRQQNIQRAWPDALDLMLICVESGISLEAAFQKVAVEIGIQSAPLAEELVLTNAELSYLQERRQAFENLAKRTGLDSIKAVSMALIQAERYGTPVANALRVLSQESRDMRMAEAEKKAAALPPKLTVPMIVFFLPVLFAVIIGPAAIKISQM